MWLRRRIHLKPCRFLHPRMSTRSVLLTDAAGSCPSRAPPYPDRTTRPSGHLQSILRSSIMSVADLVQDTRPLQSAGLARAQSFGYSIARAGSARGGRTVPGTPPAAATDGSSPRSFVHPGEFEPVGMVALPYPNSTEEARPGTPKSRISSARLGSARRGGGSKLFRSREFLDTG